MLDYNSDLIASVETETKISDYDKLNKIAILECHCPDDDYGTRCIVCIASGALNLSAEMLHDAVKEIYGQG